jgi:hypothetical protein
MIAGLLIVILLLASVYLTFRVWYLAGTLADAQEYIEDLESTNQYMYEKLKNHIHSMKQIDRLGAFESEDEAGTTFQLLKQVIEELNEEFENGSGRKKVTFISQNY